MRNTGNAETATQVFVVLTVGHLAEIDLVSPATTKQRLVIEMKSLSRCIDDVIIWQIIDVDGAAVALGQIPEFGRDLQATTRQQTRRDRCVIVGRNIPVPGYPQLVAAAAGTANFRCQQTGLARIADRKRQVRGVEYRYALEFEFDAPGCSDTLLCVEFDGSALHQPVFGLGRAGCVADPVKNQHAVLVDFHGLGTAASIAATHRKLGTLEANATGQVGKLSRLAPYLGAWVLIAHSTLKVQCPGVGFVPRGVGTGEFVAAAKHDTTGHTGSRQFPELRFETPRLKLDCGGIVQRLGWLQCLGVQRLWQRCTAGQRLVCIGVHEGQQQAC